ncbi:tetratricopeptide repeat protein [Ramlibacter sp. G-1-2-2]|uniref:Tetratricopeptide repeat protein n=2 Tax=Ramlibacter agri TaxID=2728837 RepID=A0A848H507_9BURK|nr:tetratricopeptide repeat protein [Ramlibacter agri]NML44611.1 tetratricopeptide repeat protein [Ramlibacter agri]
MLGLSRHIVTGLIDAGFVQPTRGKRNELRFTFQDLALLRTAHALQAQSIPARRILRSLARLKATLPAELPLTGLRITAIGPDVAVRDRSGRLQSDSGQLLMDFEVAPVAGTVTLLEHAASREEPSAQELFEQALSLEEDDAAAAEAAYLQALALSPDLEDAYLNLGAMWAEAGRFIDLVRLSEAALENCPQSALLHFNHGVALDHLERLDEAAAAYERSLELDPNLADAHFNLAQLRQQAGDERGALRHYSAYRRLQR